MYEMSECERNCAASTNNNIAAVKLLIYLSKWCWWWHYLWCKEEGWSSYWDCNLAYVQMAAVIGTELMVAIDSVHGTAISDDLLRARQQSGEMMRKHLTWKCKHRREMTSIILLSAFASARNSCLPAAMVILHIPAPLFGLKKTANFFSSSHSTTY